MIAGSLEKPERAWAGFSTPVTTITSNTSIALTSIRSRSLTNR